MSITRDERRIRGVLGDRFQTLRIRVDGLWYRASWGSRYGAHATFNGLLNAQGMTLAALMQEVLATELESAEYAGDAS